LTKIYPKEGNIYNQTTKSYQVFVPEDLFIVSERDSEGYKMGVYIACKRKSADIF
jgi:hypothetical protein